MEVVSESYLTFWLRRGCALSRDGLKASALDVFHPEGKGTQQLQHRASRLQRVCHSDRDLQLSCLTLHHVCTQSNWHCCRHCHTSLSVDEHH